MTHIAEDCKSSLNVEQEEPFTEKFHRMNLWEYPKLYNVANSFRGQYNLSSFTFKELDEFMWLELAPLLGAKTTQSDAGAEVENLRLACEV